MKKRISIIAILLAIVSIMALSFGTIGVYASDGGSDDGCTECGYEEPTGPGEWVQVCEELYQPGAWEWEWHDGYWTGWWYHPGYWWWEWNEGYYYTSCKDVWVPSPIQSDYTRWIEFYDGTVFGPIPCVGDMAFPVTGKWSNGPGGFTVEITKGTMIMLGYGTPAQYIIVGKDGVLNQGILTIYGGTVKVTKN